MEELKMKRHKTIKGRNRDKFCMNDNKHSITVDTYANGKIVWIFNNIKPTIQEGFKQSYKGKRWTKKQTKGKTI